MRAGYVNDILFIICITVHVTIINKKSTTKSLLDVSGKPLSGRPIINQSINFNK